MEEAFRTVLLVADSEVDRTVVSISSLIIMGIISRSTVNRIGLLGATFIRLKTSLVDSVTTEKGTLTRRALVEVTQ